MNSSEVVATVVWVVEICVNQADSVVVVVNGVVVVVNMNVRGAVVDVVITVNVVSEVDTVVPEVDAVVETVVEEVEDDCAVVVGFPVSSAEVVSVRLSVRLSE